MAVDIFIQVYDILTRYPYGWTWYFKWAVVMSCLHHRMVRLHTQSHVSRIGQGGFPLPFLRFSS